MTQTLPPATNDLDAAAARVDAAAAAVAKLDEPARAAAVELQRAVEAFHKLGLTTIVRALKADPAGKQILFDLVDDPAVYALFVMHGIVRPDPLTQARKLIESVRPYMQSHGGDVELVDLSGDTAYVRLHGACNGCSMSAVTLRQGVEEVLIGNIPGLHRVEVLPNEPGPAIIGLDTIRVRDRNEGWLRGPRADELPPGAMRRLQTPQADVLLINLDNRISAYRNACAHQGLPLDGGLFDAESGTITCPWHGFCYDAASGECLTVPQAQLEAFPLRVEEGVIWVRPSSPDR